MDVWGILLGFASGLLGLAGLLWAETYLHGRKSKYEYHEHLASPEWAATVVRLEARPRGLRCAACGTTWDLAEPHHWTYRCLGFEHLWQLVRLCRAHHTGRWSPHWWSTWLFASRTRGIWATTLAVVMVGK